MKKHYFDLFKLWLRTYFKHPLENIRQANPVVPGRLYYNFGNVCKAVKYNEVEQKVIDEAEAAILEASVINPDNSSMSFSPEGILEMVRSVHGDVSDVDVLRQAISEHDDTPPRCMLCDFHKLGIPCPIYNQLKDGSTVCDTHRYVIIKQAPHA